jgi:hypothetical protein
VAPHFGIRIRSSSPMTDDCSRHPRPRQASRGYRIKKPICTVFWAHGPPGFPVSRDPRPIAACSSCTIGFIRPTPGRRKLDSSPGWRDNMERNPLTLLLGSSMLHIRAFALVAAVQIGCGLTAATPHDGLLYSEASMSCLLTARGEGAREAMREGHSTPNDAIARAQSRCRTEISRDRWHASVSSEPDGATAFTVDTWPTGLPVRARPRDAEWVEVSFPDGRRGWVPFSQLILIYTGE